jgi:two-component system, NtrC family, nitrogen regulation sensor histidine kinase NtrY
MASSTSGATLFSAGLVVRALAFAALAYVALQSALAHLYATAVVLAGLAALVILDLWRAVTRADRLLARLAEGVTMGDLDRTGRGAAGFRQFALAIDDAAETLRNQRAAQQRRLDWLSGLVDSVPAALMVVEKSGRVVLANRAARNLAGEDAARLADIGALGSETAARLAALETGGREIVRLADGRLALASAIGFTAPGVEPQRLVSLQDVAGQLDAVELKAWQDLVRVLAHEMLNSLTPIVSLAESIQQRETVDTELAEAFDVIARRSQGLMTFVDGYRRVAEIPAPNVAPIDILVFFERLSRLLGPLFASRQVSFSTRVSPRSLAVRADADLLEQALINLIKNAVDAVDGAAAPAISVDCRGFDDRVEIGVQDNGAGFSAEDAERLFVPFFTTKPGGSGIGLSVARQIALAHHGRLDATRTPVGAAFTLSLPV